MAVVFLTGGWCQVNRARAKINKKQKHARLEGHDEEVGLGGIEGSSRVHGERFVHPELARVLRQLGPPLVLQAHHARAQTIKKGGKVSETSFLYKNIFVRRKGTSDSNEMLLSCADKKKNENMKIIQARPQDLEEPHPPCNAIRHTTVCLSRPCLWLGSLLWGEF
jgi:hypothetical protein